MSEIDLAKKVLDVAAELAKGIEESRYEILARAGRDRFQFMEKDFETRLRSNEVSGIPANELRLQLKIIGNLDLTCRRTLHPAPESEMDEIQFLIDELDKVRSSKNRLPTSPGLEIWRGELALRRHKYAEAISHFTKAQHVLESLDIKESSVPETLTTALCEGAYAYAMLKKIDKASKAAESAISTARAHHRTENDFREFCRKNFIAGQQVTAPLAAAYLMACDIRISYIEKWDATEKICSDMNFYWDRLNDEFGGLSALQVPHLIAVLSDNNWMTKRPDLAAPLARALYLKTSPNIPAAIWRRANLFLGGFRLTDHVKRAAVAGIPTAAAALLLFLASATPIDIPSDIDSISQVLGIESNNSVSIADVSQLLNADAGDSVDIGSLYNLMTFGDGSDAFGDMLQIATGGSSSVGITLV